MRGSWLVMSALVLILASALALALPVDHTDNQSSGWKTVYAIRDYFRPVTDYFVKELPSKTPSDVADDVHEKVTDVKEWAQENEAIQGLVSSLVPIKNWLKEKADTLKDKTFQDMYDGVKDRVLTLDEKVATWIQDSNSN
ncbi:uncharacterized protein [Panulirus ornatus]|uniref:uncharacterized protein n=1 Tax=Panulirus ornatus TaxID=150431 RepID=UPI003A89EFC0